MQERATRATKVRRYLPRRRAIWGAWWTVARRTWPWSYFRRCAAYRAYIDANPPTNHGARVIGPEEAAAIPDNSAVYEKLTYSYDGLDEVKAMLADGKPVAFVTWHHGARQHAEYGIARVLPQTAFFSRDTLQFGKMFTFSMVAAGALSVVKMAGSLRDGRPIHYYFDGAPLGETVRLPVLGYPSNLSTAAIRTIQSVEGVRLVPVTAYYRGTSEVHITFHCSSPQFEQLPQMSDRQILRSMIELLERDLREHAPEQVMWWFMVDRQQRADNMAEARAVSRRKMI